MTTEWMDKPDGDGLWWYTGATGHTTLWIVIGGLWQVVQKTGGHFVHDSGTPTGISATGKWQRCAITKPAPYVAPQPPKVEQYTAKVKDLGTLRFITKVADAFVVTDLDGKRSTDAAWLSRKELDRYYTDIKPIEAS